MKLVIEKPILSSTGKKAKCYYIYKDEPGIIDPVTTKRFKTVAEASAWIRCTYPQSVDFRTVLDTTS
jgi:hypothetical protein